MIQANPRLTPAAVKNILVSTADRIAKASVIRQGYGVVNARRAVALAETEQHNLKTVGCGPPRIANGRLVFVFHDDEAKSVSLAGDFNQWDTASRPSLKTVKAYGKRKLPPRHQAFINTSFSLMAGIGWKIRAME